MKGSLTRDDVIREIEFELTQGTISKDELGKAIRTVRQFGNEARRETFERGAHAEERDVAARLFQLNDMQTTLLEEMASMIQTLRLELRGSQASPPRPSHGTTNGQDRGTEIARGVPIHDTLPAMSSLGMGWRPRAEIEEAMDEDALDLDLDVRPTTVPVIGSLIKRVRVAVHDLSLFYVGRLAKKQVEINRTYGEWLLHLNSQVQSQQEQITYLSEQVGELQERLQTIEGGEAADK